MARIESGNVTCKGTLNTWWGRRTTGPWTFDSTSTVQLRDDGTVSPYVVRDDIRKTPKGAPRVPLPYNANGRQGFSIYVNGTWRYQRGSVWERRELNGTMYNAVPSIPPGDELPDSVIAERKIRLMKKIADQKWSVGQALAEASESVGLLAKSSRTLHKALTHAVRKDWRGVARTLGVAPRRLGKAADTVADGWLAYHFGWAPLVDDMTGAMILISGVDDWEKKLLTVSATSSVTQDRSRPFKQEPQPLIVGNNNYTPFVGYSCEAETTTAWRARVTYSVDLPQLRKLQQHGLLGASTVWAVMPASYILDWIVPVADYLAALEADAGLSFLHGYETRFSRTTYKNVVPLVTRGQTTVEEFSTDIVSEGRAFRVSRGPWTGLMPPFYVKDPLSLWRATTALALFKRDAYSMRSSLSRS